MQFRGRAGKRRVHEDSEIRAKWAKMCVPPPPPKKNEQVPYAYACCLDNDHWRTGGGGGLGGACPPPNEIKPRLIFNVPTKY